MDADADYLFAADRGVIMVRWRRPNPRAVDQLTDQILSKCDEADVPVMVVVIIDHETPTPDGETRTAFDRGLEMFGDRVQGQHIVLLGEGLQMTVIRSVVTTMMLVAGLRGRKVFVHKDIAAITSLVTERSGRSAREFITWLRTRTLLSGAEADAALAKLGA